MRPIKNILIVQPYGIGDLLFLTPVMRALKAHPGVEKIDIILGSRTDVMLEKSPYIHQTIPIDKDLFHKRSWFENIKSMWQLFCKLQKGQYDLLLDYSFRDEFGFLGKFFLGIPVRAGYRRKRRGLFHNRFLKIAGGFDEQHVVDYVCDLCEQAGIQVPQRELDYFIDDQDRDGLAREIQSRVSFLNESFVVISPGGGESWGKDAYFKRWPADYFSELVKKLYDAFNFKGVILVGSSGEKELSQKIVAGVSEEMDCVDLVGQLSLNQTAALIEKASLFVGNDGGLIHIAHALKVNLVGFYGPVSPKSYGPYPQSDQALVLMKEDLDCWPCYKSFRYNQDCVGHECLTQLTPDAAFTKIRTHFDGYFSASRTAV